MEQSLVESQSTNHGWSRIYADEVGCSVKPSVLIRVIRGSIPKEENENRLDASFADADQFADGVGVEFAV